MHFYAQNANVFIHTTYQCINLIHTAHCTTVGRVVNVMHGYAIGLTSSDIDAVHMLHVGGEGVTECLMVICVASHMVRLRNNPLEKCHRRQEMEKKRKYEERIREIEHGSFSPLAFNIAGGMGATTTVVYKRLASLIAEKHDKRYGQTPHWMRCRLNLSLLRSSIMCLRRSRSHINHPHSFKKSNSMELACAEGRVTEEH